MAALDVPGVVAFVSARPQLAEHVGPAGSEGEWSVKEVGDGNINFVFIVQVRHLREGSGWAPVHRRRQGGSHMYGCVQGHGQPSCKGCLQESHRPFGPATSACCVCRTPAQGPSGGVCLKQSLPYVRCVGEGWPLSQDRCRIEAEALQLEHKLCPQHTPEVRHYAGLCLRGKPAAASGSDANLRRLGVRLTCPALPLA